MALAMLRKNKFAISIHRNFETVAVLTAYKNAKAAYITGMCSRDSNSSVMDSTYCYTANESGIYYHPIKGSQSNCYH
jgi:hypothetical protein